MLERLNNENMESKIFFEKLHIQINELTEIVKRKIIDLLVFSLLKKNEKPFFLEKKYCPTISFIEKMQNKFIDNRDDITKEDKEKIDA